MKKIYLIFLLIFLVNVASANPVITADHNNGEWKNNSTWDLNRKPKDGDTVVIPAGIQVTIDNNVNLNNATIYLKVMGTLELDGGKLRLDENSIVTVFNGAVIIAHGNNNEQIKIGNILKFNGSYSIIVSGPAIADFSSGEAPSGFKAQGSGALPVKFIGFDIAFQNNNILIDWITAQELNSKYFEIQRSENGNSWITVGTVPAAGTTSTVQKYSYTDHSVTGEMVFYRIRQEDIDGGSVYTLVRSLKMTKQNDLQIKISSGMNKNIYIHFSNQVKSEVDIKVLSLNGQLVYHSFLNNPVGQHLLSMDNNLRGIFVVKLSDGNKLIASEQVQL